MFGSLLIVMSSLCAEPVEVLSFATCTRPTAKVVAPRNEHAAWARRSTDGHQVALCLRLWEYTARDQPEQPVARRDVLRHRLMSDVNAHAAAAAETLTGPIDVTELQANFTWIIADHYAARICLEAIPIDETERLFYGSIRVWLDGDSGRLDELQIIDRQGITRSTWRAEPAQQPAVIQQAAFIETTPVIEESPLQAPVPSRAIFRTRKPTLIAALSEAFPYDESVDPVGLAPASPDVDEILTKWESASREIRTAKVRFSRTMYNNVFETEKWAEGELVYEGPDRVSIAVRAAEMPQMNRAGGRMGPKGGPFRVEADRSESWIWTERELTVANDEDKILEVFELPQSGALRANQWWWFPISAREAAPFIFHIRADQIRREWSLTLKKREAGTAILEAEPRAALLKRRFSRCLVMLDTTTWQATAVKYVDASGHLETVYKAIESQVNSDPPPKCPEAADLKNRGYKLITPSWKNDSASGTSSTDSDR